MGQTSARRRRIFIMLTFDQYWGRLAARNLRLLAAPKIQMTPASFKQQIRLAYLAGADGLEPESAGPIGAEPPQFLRDLFPFRPFRPK